MKWGNLPVPGHLQGGAAVTAFFHHVCDCLCISRFERQFKIFADVSTLNFESTSWLVCSQISWPSCLMGCITPILLKICSTSLSLRSSIRSQFLLARARRADLIRHKFQHSRLWSALFFPADCRQSGKE